MEYSIFSYTNNLDKIDSFLESASMAHNQTKKTKEWFLWKFRDNPYGESIMACAEDQGNIVGCVAYGMQKFCLNDKSVNGAFAFENFVHPDYQGRGIFKKLISLTEKEANRKGIELLLVFPNVKSLPGYKRMKWSQISPPEYWIKPIKLISFLFKIHDLRRKFKPNRSNLDSLNSPDEIEDFPTNTLKPIITKEYLDWRFFTFPVSEYLVLNREEYYSIVRIGYRGNIKEGQVLFINIKDKDNYRTNNLIKHCREESGCDMISFSISKTNHIRSLLLKSLFLKVPNKTNICFKILNESRIKFKDVTSISLSAINYHTY